MSRKLDAAAKAQPPDHTPDTEIHAKLQQAVALHRQGRFDEAAALYSEVRRINPRQFDAIHLLGVIAVQSNNHQLGADLIAQAIAINPDHAEAYYNRGLALKELKQWEAAVESYNMTVALEPRHASAYGERGVALQSLNRLEEAIASYDAAIRVKPDYAEAYYNRGLALQELKQFEAAVESYDKVIALDPVHANAHNNRGNALMDLTQFAAAVASYDKAISLRPNDPLTYRNRGTALREMGRIEDARKDFCKSIELDPAKCGVYFDLANSWKFSAGDRYLDAMEKLVAAATGSDRMHLDFALGKAYADIKDYRRSFAHLLASNSAKRTIISYDESSAFAYFDRIEQVFTPELVAAKAGGGEPSTRPIFVLGMPRSGTTLVEQLLASHPAVHGAGELKMLNDVILTVRGSDGKTISYPEFVSTLDQSALRAIGAEYVKRLAALVPEGERVTDKMPANYYFAGLIHLALPHAVIIHTMRNPVDTCVSCFSQLFSDEQNHTYELGELGRYYVRYHRLMDHWRRVLPPGRILDVRYEDVIADLEGQARRILAHCGLPWDERCLAFHQTDRPVRTASATQVRQPIYKTAVGRWRVYEDELAPLLSALGPLAAQVGSRP